MCPKLLVRNHYLRANGKNSSNKTKVTVHEFLVNLCFIAAILILFCLPVNHDFVRVLSGTIYGQTKKNEYGSNKTKVDQKLLRSKFCFIAAILIFFRLPVNHDFVRVLSGTKPSFTGKRKKMSIAAIKQRLLCMNLGS